MFSLSEFILIRQFVRVNVKWWIIHLKDILDVHEHTQCTQEHTVYL